MSSKDLFYCHELSLWANAGVFMQSMYIRVKRSKTTYFIQCEPTESTLNVKEKLQSLIDQPVNDQRLILLETGEVLEDSKSLADQKVHIVMLIRWL